MVFKSDYKAISTFLLYISILITKPVSDFRKKTE